MSKKEGDLRKTPLYNKHLGSGAKMVPFSGWDMPVQYTGIIEEHLHTRAKAGLFDICHMGEFFIKGPTADRDLDRLVTCRIDDMPPGKCRYGFMLNEEGGIIDDLIVFKISEGEYMLVVNAGTVDKDRKWVEKNVSRGNFFIDDSDNIAKIDIQGPSSGEIMASLAGEKTVSALKRFCFTKVDIKGVMVLSSRTGYTGELGYELFFPVSSAEEVWDMLLKSGDVKPVGLGARDTLRIEMGYSLYGSDIDEDHTPFEANLARFVCMDKDFIGKEALLQQEAEGVRRFLMGFVCEGRRAAREHFDVIVDGKRSGEITSGAFSPCLKRGIGLCYIERDLATEGREILLSDGKVEIKATLKNVPLYKGVCEAR
jgi:aminomethyltransferase